MKICARPLMLLKKSIIQKMIALTEGVKGLPPAARLTDSVVIPAKAKLIFIADLFRDSIRKSFFILFRILLFKVDSSGAEIYIFSFVRGNDYNFIFFYFIESFI